MSEGIRYPKAISVNNFVGGYLAASDFTDLGPTETNNARNVVYGPNANISQRAGSRRLLNARLSPVGSTAGSEIRGHYHFRKLGTNRSIHVVTAGGQIFDYSSSTANSVLTGQDDSSGTFYTFAQIGDPRSASDDIVVISNGIDAMSVYNGTGTAVLLSAFTSATQVPVARYITNFKRRVYAANVVDSTNVDAPVQVFVTEFGGDGAPNPHRFTNNFFVGGSDRDGEITGILPLGDNIIIYTRKSIWKFTPGSTNTLATASLRKMKSNLGCLAPRSLVDLGTFHMFLTERGVWTFDGETAAFLSEKIDIDLYENGNAGVLDQAVAEFNAEQNQYILYYASQGSTRNDKALIFDWRIKSWQPPVLGREVAVVSNFNDSEGTYKVIYGDYVGYLYEDCIGVNDGLQTGFNGNPSVVGSINTLTDDDAGFNTAGDGLAGVFVSLISGTGIGQTRQIISNTSGVLTLDQNWTILPNTATVYVVGSIESYWQSKDYDFGDHDIVKMFRFIRTRLQETGNFNLILHYLIDFKDITVATSAIISLLGSGMAWGIGVWGTDRWGGRDVVQSKISVRSTPNQTNKGNHMALRFTNSRANEDWSLSGYDLEMRQVGRR